jgi:hypothetical protein
MRVSTWRLFPVVDGKEHSVLKNTNGQLHARGINPCAASACQWLDRSPRIHCLSKPEGCSGC